MQHDTPRAREPFPNAQPEWIDAKASAKAKRAAEARQISGRRRGVDPTTSERDYSAEELEFMRAMHAYKHSSGRMFPTWSEVLEVLRGLGYDKEPSSSPAGPGETGGPTAA
jgi:hypothetical protein